MLQNVTQNKCCALDIIALSVEKPVCDVAWMLQVYVLYSVSYIRYFIWIIIRLANLHKTKKVKMIVEGKRRGFIGERERGVRVETAEVLRLVLSSLVTSNLPFIFTRLALHIL